MTFPLTGSSVDWFICNVITDASTMALAQDVACAAMLVEGCHANTCLCNGIYKLMCFPWEPGGVIAACVLAYELFPLTNLCIYG